MSKELTPRQKKIQVQRAIKSFLKNELEPMMLDYVNKEIDSKTPQDIAFMDNNSKVYKTVIKKFTKNV